MELTVSVDEALDVNKEGIISPETDDPAVLVARAIAAKMRSDAAIHHDATDGLICSD